MYNDMRFKNVLIYSVVICARMQADKLHDKAHCHKRNCI